jgi:DHA2 family multidrug resistance protein-like MFS transporter
VSLGYRRIYLLGMTVFVIASVAATLASSLATLIAARVFQGMGAAGIMSVNAALVRLTYPRAMLGRGMAINSLVVATSSMAGPSVAAAILSVASWPGCCHQCAAGLDDLVDGAQGAAGQPRGAGMSR